MKKIKELSHRTYKKHKIKQKDEEENQNENENKLMQKYANKSFPGKTTLTTKFVNISGKNMKCQ